MAEISAWDPTAANNNDPPPDGAPENTMQYSAVNDTMREMYAVMARFYRDNNGSLTSGGAANAQTLTPNGTYGSYVQGLTFTFKAGFSNTGATTMNVGGLGAVSVLSHNGSALATGDIIADGIYTIIHDGSQFRLIGGQASGGLPSDLVASTISLSSTTAVALASTGHAFQIGADGVDNLVADPDTIQARNAGAAATLEINPLGGNVAIGEDAANANSVILYHFNTIVRGGTARSLQVQNRADGAPALGTPHDVVVDFASSGSVSRGRVGFDSSAHLSLKNLNDGGDVLIQANDAGSTLRTLATFDPDTQDTTILGAIYGTDRLTQDVLTLSGSKTLLLTDQNTAQYFTDATGINLTIPPNATTAFPVGTRVWIHNNSSASATITLVAGGGVTLVGTTSITDETVAVLTKVDTDVWTVLTEGAGGGGGANTLDQAYDQGGAGAGRAITMDSGPLDLDVSTTDSGALDIDIAGPLSSSVAALAIDYGTGAWTGAPSGLTIDYSGMTSLNNAGDVAAIDLTGVTNAGAGASVGIQLTGFDEAIKLLGANPAIVFDGDVVTAGSGTLTAAGAGSVVLGQNAGSTIATAGLNNVLIGSSATLLNTSVADAVAVGPDSIAATNSVAVGHQARADGTETTALGWLADAGGVRALALGRQANASGIEAIAQGALCTASHNYAWVVGRGATSDQANSITFGSATQEFSKMRTFGLTDTEFVHEFAFVETTDATQGILWSLTVPDDSVVFVKALVIAAGNSGGEEHARELQAVFERNGGGSAASVGAGGIDLNVSGATATSESWSAGIQASGNDVQITANGAAAQNIEWRGWVKYFVADRHAS